MHFFFGLQGVNGRRVCDLRALTMMC